MKSTRECSALIAASSTARSYQGVTAARLYNLASDPGETKELVAARPDRIKALQAKWDAWNAGKVKPLWCADDSDSDEPGAAPRRKKTQPEN